MKKNSARNCACGEKLANLRFAYIQHQHQHFMTFHIQHFIFHDIYHFMKVNMTVEGSAVARIGRRESPFAMVIENPVALGGTPPLTAVIENPGPIGFSITSVKGLKRGASCQDPIYLTIFGKAEVRKPFKERQIYGILAGRSPFQS